MTPCKKNQFYFNTSDVVFFRFLFFHKSLFNNTQKEDDLLILFMRIRVNVHVEEGNYVENFHAFST